jgi:hypothetical protein
VFRVACALLVVQMTDVEIIVTAATTIAAAAGATVRWAVNRVVRALDENTKALKESAVSSAVFAETNRALTADVRAIKDWCDSHTGVADVPNGIREKPAPRARTHPEGIAIAAAGGYGPMRGGRDG